MRGKSAAGGGRVSAGGRSGAGGAADVLASVNVSFIVGRRGVGGKSNERLLITTVAAAPTDEPKSYLTACRAQYFR